MGPISSESSKLDAQGTNRLFNICGNGIRYCNNLFRDSQGHTKDTHDPDPWIGRLGSMVILVKGSTTMVLGSWYMDLERVSSKYCPRPTSGSNRVLKLWMFSETVNGEKVYYP